MIPLTPDAPVPSAPVEVMRTLVRPEWIDHNGHFNAGYYLVAFDQAIDAWLEFVGLGTAQRDAQPITTFSAQNHVTYVREIGEGDEFSVTAQLLGFDRKRIHSIEVMHHARDGFVAATCEVMSLHVNMATRRVAPMADAPYARLAQIWEAHQALAPPPQTAKTIAVPPPPR